MTRHRNNPELDAAIVKAFKANPEMSKTALAGFMGCSRYTIDRALKRAGLDHLVMSTKYTDETLWKEVKAVLDNDIMVTREEIVDRFKISFSTFDRMVAYFNYDMRKRYEQRRKAKRTQNVDYDAVLDALENTDATVFDITHKFRINHHELQRFCEEQGIDLRERRREIMENGVQKSTECFEAKETLDGNGWSFLAHRLPLNRIAEVFR